MESLRGPVGIGRPLRQDWFEDVADRAAGLMPSGSVFEPQKTAGLFYIAPPALGRLCSEAIDLLGRDRYNSNLKSRIAARGPRTMGKKVTLSVDAFRYIPAPSGEGYFLTMLVRDVMRTDEKWRVEQEAISILSMVKDISLSAAATNVRLAGVRLGNVTTTGVLPHYSVYRSATSGRLLDPDNFRPVFDPVTVFSDTDCSGV